jgi:hypothetical protein
MWCHYLIGLARMLCVWDHGSIERDNGGMAKRQPQAYRWLQTLTASATPRKSGRCGRDSRSPVMGYRQKIMTDAAAVKNAVAADPKSIGYIDKADVDDTVKVVLSLN